MSLKVAKFGGSSLADAGQFRKVRDIVAADPARRYVVDSAPGRRHKLDPKVTDLLYLCHAHARQGIGFDEVFTRVSDRFSSIVTDLASSSTSPRTSARSAARSPPAPAPTTPPAAASTSTG